MDMEDLYRLLRTGHMEAQGIVDTLDVPVAVLDQGFCILNVNRAFCKTFTTERDDTIGHSLFLLGNGQWDPSLGSCWPMSCQKRLLSSAMR